MSNFRNQIEADLAEYQELYPHIEHINKDEWAFNFWILDKLFYEDEELIESKIIEYSDMGIDCYEFYEDTKELFIIQNKYYSENSTINKNYVENDFLLRAITALERGTYTKSSEIQSFFNKYKDDENFSVYLQLYITNNKKNTEVDNCIKAFNLSHRNYHARVFYLDDIEEKYYGEVEQKRATLTATIESINKHTILNINSEDYKLPNILDARYVFTPVVSLYKIYKNALGKGYPIFDKNIREFLGKTGFNKNIIDTLRNDSDRKNFFYYNNGVTMICDSMSSIQTKIHAYFTVENPQIVNGCQTVNSIYEVLKDENPAIIEEKYKDAFVMLKILVIDKQDDADNNLYRNIVKYNNSQNPIDEKTFTSNNELFSRLQNVFEGKGFLLLIKQSDKQKFNNKYKITTQLKELNSRRLERFGLSQMKKASDVFIPIEKLLQVINAFVRGGYIAYVRKSNMLKFDSTEYNTAIAFVKSVTHDVLLDLFLLYMRAEKEKKNDNSDSRNPIPYYLIDGFSKYECSGRDPSLISVALSSKEKIDGIISLYTRVTRFYSRQYERTYGIDYNKMIKRNVDYEMFDDAVYTNT